MRAASKTALIGAVGFVLSAMIAMPVAAQAALFDEAALTAACDAGQCAAEVWAIVEELRAADLPESEFNSQIGFMAALLLQDSKTAAPDALSGLSAALDVLARSTGDARQAAAIAQVAEAVATGQASAVQASAPYAASPSRPFNWWNRPPPPFQSGRSPGRSRNPWFGFWRR
jgi:hypothetical protein